jgi:hypothetical protein
LAFVRARAIWLSALAGLAACGRATAFECTQDGECGEGRCEPSSGYCSFVDDACPTGWKYGAHAGEGLAGQCVDPGGGSGDTNVADVGDDAPGPTSAADDGDDGDDGDTTGQPGTSSLETGGLACEVGTCLDAPPDGWLGPTAVLTGTGSIPACPAALPTTLALGHTMLAADPATCGCGCDPVPGSCGEITLSVDQVGATCDMGTDLLLEEGVCVDALSTAASITVAHAAAPDAGSCQTNSFMEVTPPAWLDHLRVCATDDPGTCDGDGVCLPAMADADVCILRAGDVPCPAGAYSARTVVYGDYLDGRDCSDCGCNVQSAVCQIEIRQSSDCTGAPEVTWTTSTAHCDAFAVPVGESFTAVHETVDNCSGVGGDPIGAVMPIDPTTLCCVP